MKWNIDRIISRLRMMEDNDTPTTAAGQLTMCTYKVYSACINKSAEYLFQTLYCTMQVNPETMIPIKLDEFGVPVKGAIWVLCGMPCHYLCIYSIAASLHTQRNGPDADQAHLILRSPKVKTTKIRHLPCFQKFSTQ